MRNTVMREVDAIEPAESVASSAVKTAIDLRATMVVVLSETGNTARLLAKYRPDMPILAFTAAADAARQMNGYLRNVHTQVNDEQEDRERDRQTEAERDREKDFEYTSSSQYLLDCYYTYIRINVRIYQYLANPKRVMSHE